MSEVDCMGNRRKCGKRLDSSADFCPQCDGMRFGPTILGPTQPFKCPCCDGTGKVSRPPWVAGDVLCWTDGGGGILYACKACLGTGILWR